MDKLTYELKALCKHNRDGSHGTQAQRRKQLRLIAAQLKQLGFRHMGVQSLKAKHVEAIVDHWLTKPSDETHKLISAGTIKNRMSAQRWWAGKISKSGVIPNDNRALGIPDRKRIADFNRAFKLEARQLNKLPPYLKISIRLQQEFGLRRKEAGMIVPAKGIKEDHIALKSSWTKGGRPRTIPITTVGQRELLKDIATLKQNASLIPAHMSFKQYISHRDHHLAIAGIKRAHGLRHYYAQQRYIVLSKGLMPPKLQKGERAVLTPAEHTLDISTRLTVSQELGHGRIDVTREYLG